MERKTFFAFWRLALRRARTDVRTDFPDTVPFILAAAVAGAVAGALISSAEDRSQHVLEALFTGVLTPLALWLLWLLFNLFLLTPAKLYIEAAGEHALSAPADPPPLGFLDHLVDVETLSSANELHRLIAKAARSIAAITDLYLPLFSLVEPTAREKRHWSIQIAKGVSRKTRRLLRIHRKLKIVLKRFGDSSLEALPHHIADWSPDALSGLLASTITVREHSESLEHTAALNVELLRNFPNVQQSLAVAHGELATFYEGLSETIRALAHVCRQREVIIRSVLEPQASASPDSSLAPIAEPSAAD